MPPPGGILVEFRDQGTDTLLWIASLNLMPKENDVLTHKDADGVEKTYELNQVRWNFFSPNPMASFDNEISCTNAKCRPVAFVTEV